MDTEDHADLMSLLNDTVDRQVLPMSDMHIGSRQVHSDERTCTHCSRRGECWDEIFERIGLPERFSLRSGWDENRMHNHMLGVLGQVCGSFEHSNREINARQVQAERRRRDNTGEGNDWDTEENQ